MNIFFQDFLKLLQMYFNLLLAYNAANDYTIFYNYLSVSMSRHMCSNCHIGIIGTLVLHSPLPVALQHDNSDTVSIL